ANLCLMLAVGTICLCGSGAAAADLTAEATAASYNEASAPAWNGLYLGGHLGYAWGNSNWTASTAAAPAHTIAAGVLDLSQSIDIFKESGSFFEGLQIGYNYTLANRLVIGAEADVSFPAFPDPITGLSIGGASRLLNNAESYSENVLASGTVRGRIGYAPGS